MIGMEHDDMAAALPAEGMPLSVALGNSPIRLIGEGHSSMALHSIGNRVEHIAGDMGQKVAAQTAPAPQEILADFKNTFKPV